MPKVYLILPCPFCNKDASLVSFNGDSDYDWRELYHEVRCSTTDCYLEGGANFSFDSPEEAVLNWNKRNLK